MCSVRPARDLVSRALTQLRDAWPATLPTLSESERRQLVHTLRHTFDIRTVASGVPLDVAQRVLGDASLQTATIYVTAEQQRIRAGLCRYFGMRHETD